jgi:hypothetical protein
MRPGGRGQEQAKFDAFLREFNAERPQEAIIDNPFHTRLSPMSSVRSVTHVSGSDRARLVGAQGLEPWTR